MKLHTCVLASTSAGNCTLVWDSTNAIMIDCGLNPSYTEKEMKKLRLDYTNLSGVLLTHLHSDHVNDNMLNRIIQNQVPLICHSDLKKHFICNYKSASVADQMNLLKTFGNEWFLLDNFGIQGFRLRHDSPGGCFGYKIYKKIDNVTRKLTIATDTGFPGEDVIRNFYDSDVIIVESNHNVEMLENSGRPLWLQKRIRNAHMSNEECSRVIDLVVSFSTRKLKKVILAHLSDDCNTPELALGAVRKRIENNAGDFEILLSYKNIPSEKVSL